MIEKPLLTFGILTDIQYADVDDGASNKGKKRYYRQSLDKVKNAVISWKNYEKNNDQKIAFILQLGDLIDGKSKNNSYNAMNTVLNELNQCFSHEDLSKSVQPKLLHTWGNHEMYNFKRNELIKTPLYTRRDLNQTIPDVNANYYTFDITDNLILINLDFYELSVIGYDIDHEYYIEALKLIEFYNKNSNLNDGSNLPDDKIHHVAYNGGDFSYFFKIFNKRVRNKNCTRDKTQISLNLSRLGLFFV